MFIKNLIMTLLIIVSFALVGCSDDKPPYEVWVDSAFLSHDGEADAVLAGLKEWNDKLAPRGTRSFIFKGFRTDSFDSGDDYDDWIQIYRATYDQVPLSDLQSGSACLMAGDPINGTLVVPTAAEIAGRSFQTIGSITRELLGKYDGINVVGLAGPRNDALIFNERIAGNKDPETFNQNQYANYLDTIRRVSAHELGHVVDLIHSKSDKDVMYPYVGAEHLSSGDIEAYCFSNDCN